MILLKKFENKRIEKMQEREDAVDKLDAKLTEFLVKLGSLDLPEQESITVTSLIKTGTEFEKISDYGYKFSKIVEDMHEKKVKLSDFAY